MTATGAPARLVAVSALAFGYRGRAVFSDLTFSVGAGELVALCGPNGAGKSTLLRLLLGLHRPWSGSVALGGQPIAALSRRDIARRAALLPQDAPAALPLTVREAVGLGRLAHLGRFQAESRVDADAIARALAATDTLGLAERAVTQLSGGERQRVHLARALAQEAPLVLLDEPIAGLDLAHQLQALDLLRATVDAGGRAAVVALHDLSLAARCCDRMLLLAGGALRADDAPAAVLTPATLADVFGVEAEVRRDAAGRPYVVAGRALAAAPGESAR